MLSYCFIAKQCIFSRDCIIMQICKTVNGLHSHKKSFTLWDKKRSPFNMTTFFSQLRIFFGVPRQNRAFARKIATHFSKSKVWMQSLFRLKLLWSDATNSAAWMVCEEKCTGEKLKCWRCCCCPNTFTVLQIATPKQSVAKLTFCCNNSYLHNKISGNSQNPSFLKRALCHPADDLV